MTKKNYIKSIFSKGLTIWDLILWAIILPYLVLLYRGISYDSGILALYQLLAQAVFYATIIKYVVSFIIKKTKKK